MSVLLGILPDQTPMIDDNRWAPLAAMLMNILKESLVYLMYWDALIDALFNSVSTAHYFISSPKLNKFENDDSN